MQRLARGLCAGRGRPRCRARSGLLARPSYRLARADFGWLGLGWLGLGWLGLGGGYLHSAALIRFAALRAGFGSADLDGRRIALASRGGGSIEAPFIVRRCGFYYLFVSFGACCQGVNSTYNINVGRSPELAGPYVDRAGRPLLDGGGTLVLQAGGDWVGPGHNAILFDGPRAYNIYHAYAATNGASQLRIADLVWDAEGWPVSGGP